MRPLLANQPAKVYPALVGAVGAARIEAAVWVVVAVTAEPPLDWKVTFRVLAVHFANKDKLPVRVTDCELV